MWLIEFSVAILNLATSIDRSIEMKYVCKFFFASSTERRSMEVDRKELERVRKNDR